MKFNRSVSLVAWGYNEEALIRGFLERATALIAPIVDDYEIVYVDDGSTDGSISVLEECAQLYPKLRVIRNGENLNVGLSCRRAVDAAAKEYVLWQTVDWSYDLTNLSLFLSLTQDFDVVQGIRPVPFAMLSRVPVLRSIHRVSKRSDNLFKAVISLTNYYLLRLLFGVPFTDFQNITIYPRALIQSLPMQGRSAFVNPEYLLKAYLAGATFIEVPIPFIKRQVGDAKGTKPMAVIRACQDIVLNFLSWGWRVRFYKPSKRQIFRVSAPFNLPDEVLTKVVPLFKSFKQTE